ncbi:MAG: hypothetical protein HUU55_23105 [Myxococcales bacterium]|nr:hypothetical protein [Myxococcales bacterium]
MIDPNYVRKYFISGFQARCVQLALLSGWVCFFVVGAACSGNTEAKSKKDKPAMATGTAAAAPDKPTLALRTGTLDLKTGAPWVGKAVSRHTKDGVTYLMISVPASEDPDIGVSYDRVYDAHLGTSLKGRAVIAAPSHQGIEQHYLYLRLLSDSPPKSFSVDVIDKGRRYMPYRNEPWNHHVLTVGDLSVAADDAELPSRFFLAAQMYFQTWGQLGFRNSSMFASFASARSALLSGNPATPDWDQQQRRFDDLTEMMSLYTGALSIQEALQSDRGLLLARSASDQPTIPISDVAGVPLSDHPFAKMIQTSGKKPKMEPLANRVPADFLYFTFHEMRDAVALLNDFEQWLWPIAQLVEGRGDAANLAARYQEQLAVERTRLAEVLGPLAVEEIAFAASDPFFREGADLTILFKLKRRELLVSALDLYEQSTRKKHADVTVSEYKIGDVAVRQLSTPDFAVNQHRAEWDDVLVLSNSRAAMERFVAVRKKETPSLAESPDFQYMRTLYPFSATDETGFVFIGDGFVRNAISPKTKILQARRMAARADLLSAGFAALYYGWLNGSTPNTVEQLLQSGVLRTDDLRHTDNSPITLSFTTGASSHWGTAYRLKPLLDADITLVSEAEKNAYERFSTTYQSYWKSYIDPIAIRIVRQDSGKTLSLDARMIPLIEATEYDDLIEMVGKARVRPPKPDKTMQWTFAVGSDAKLRKELDTLAQGLGDSTLSFGWLGDWVCIGLQESAVLWDLAVMTGEIPQKPSPDNRRDISWGLLAKSPLYVGAHVKNGLGLATTLTAIRTMVNKTAPGLVDWGPGETWRNVPIVAIRPSATAPVPDDGARSLGLYYATPKDVIVASLDLDTLKRVIDHVLDGTFSGSTSAVNDHLDAQALLNAHFSDASWALRAVLGLAEQGVRLATGHAMIDIEALTRGKVGLKPNDPTFEMAALSFLGSIPSSVHGGTFELDKWGYPVHSLFGSEPSPNFPDIPIANSPLTRLVEGLTGIRFGLVFEGEGPERGLRVQMGWTRK